MTKKYCIHAQAGVSLTETSAVINPCCLFQSNGEMPTLFDVSTLDNLHQTDPYVKTQQQLQQGLEVTQCSRCTAHEALGIKSKRQHSNQLFSDTTIVPGYVYDLEIALDYTCNMMCRMCSPMSSSKWGAAYGLLEELANTGIDVGYVKHKSYKNYQDQFYKVFNNTSFKYMKHIKIEGGEPFYAKNLEWFLEKLYNESDNVADIKLNIFSNGSIFPDSSILKKLESFQTNITFSLDAYGDLATVIRYGVDWKDIELSLRQWSNYAKNSEIFLCTNTTLNIMNINMVDPLLEFCNDLNIDVNYNDLHYPNYLSMYQLPLHVRQKWQDTKKKKTFNEFLLADVNVNPEFNKFLKFTYILDTYQRMSLRDVNPEMYEIIHQLYKE